MCLRFGGPGAQRDRHGPTCTRATGTATRGVRSSVAQLSRSMGEVCSFHQSGTTSQKLLSGNAVLRSSSGCIKRRKSCFDITSKGHMWWGAVARPIQGPWMFLRAFGTPSDRWLLAGCIVLPLVTAGSLRLQVRRKRRSLVLRFFLCACALHFSAIFNQLGVEIEDSGGASDSWAFGSCLQVPFRS